MATYNPTKVRPRDGWLVVLAEKRKTILTSGLILSPVESGLEKVSEGTGMIIRVGPGEKNARLGLERGLRVLYRGFLKHANPIETDEKWPDGEAKNYFIMSSEDVLAVVVDTNLDIGVFSGRPQVPEMK